MFFFYYVMWLLIHLVIINSANNHGAPIMCHAVWCVLLDTAQASKSSEIYASCCISFVLYFLSFCTFSQWTIFSSRLLVHKIKDGGFSQALLYFHYIAQYLAHNRYSRNISEQENKWVNDERILKETEDVEEEEREQAEHKVLHFHAPRFPGGTA